MPRDEFPEDAVYKDFYLSEDCYVGDTATSRSLDNLSDRITELFQLIEERLPKQPTNQTGGA